MNLARASIDRPVTVAMVFIGLAMMGVFAAFKLPIEQFPEIEIPFVGIGIPYPNSTAQEVERNITRPVEEVLSIMSGIDTLHTFSRPGYVHISLMLDFDKDVTGKGIEAKELIEGIRHRLPEEVRHIQLRQEDPNATPVLNMLITAPALRADEAYAVLDAGVRSELERIPGVNSVSLFGIDKEYVRIALDPGRIEAYGLDYLDIQRRLMAENFYVSCGKIESSRVEYQVRPVGQFESLEAIGNLPINQQGLKLNDVAEISMALSEDSRRRTVNGNRSLGVSVFKRPEANLVRLSREINLTLDRIRERQPFSAMVFTFLDSQAKTVLRSLTDLRDSGLLGGLLSILVLFLFLRNAMTSLLIAATVPLALCATLGLMYFLGMSLNILSLVGLMLAIGLLVDNSVVVSEAISLRRDDSGTDPRTAAQKGVSEVALAITAGTLTTVIVFVPSFMTDIQQVAVLQQNIAIPLCASLLGSLLVAQTLVPTLLARLPMSRTVQHHPIIDRMAAGYEQIVRWTLGHRLVCFIIAILIALSGWGAYRMLEVNMNPEEESPRLQLNYYVRGSMDIEVIEEFVERVESYLLVNREKFQIENIFSSYDTDRGSTTINLIENGRLSPQRVEAMVMEDIPDTPGVRLRFSSQSRGHGGRGGGGLGIKLIGESTDELIRIADELVTQLEHYPTLNNVRTDAESVRQELRVRLKPEQAGQLGVTAVQVAQSIAIAIGGRQLRRGYQEDGREIEIFMELEGKDDADISTLQNLPIFLSNGDTALLQTVADISFESTLRTIRRENRETSINLNFSSSVPPDEAQALVTSVLEKYQLPAGYRWQIGDEFERDREMFREMLINTVAAIILVYMLMAALFESVLFPSTVLIAIGYSAVGVFWFLWATGTTLTAMALTGMLLLAGMVVNNGIVLLNRVIQLRREGIDRTSAIVASGRHRLRPILMTVCTTIAGLLPLAVGDVRVGGVGPTYFPMARAIIGGLAFSTLITLILLPLVYVLLDDLKISIGKFWRSALLQADKGVSVAKD